MLDVNTQPPVKAHPLIGYPRDKKKGKDVTTPVVDQQAKSGQNDDHKRDPMAETVLAGENVKEFTLKYVAAGLALVITYLSPFAKYLFLRDGPGNAGDDHGKNREPVNLFSDRHLK